MGKAMKFRNRLNRLQLLRRSEGITLTLIVLLVLSPLVLLIVASDTPDFGGSESIYANQKPTTTVVEPVSIRNSTGLEPAEPIDGGIRHWITEPYFSLVIGGSGTWSLGGTPCGESSVDLTWFDTDGNLVGQTNSTEIQSVSQVLLAIGTVRSALCRVPNDPREFFGSVVIHGE